MVFARVCGMRNGREIPKIYAELYIMHKCMAKNSLKIVMKKMKKLLSFVLVFSFGDSGIRSMGVSMSKIYNPVNSLYSDNSDIVFTNGTLSGENLSFFVPVVGNYEIIGDGTVVFTIKNSIMVKSSESGIVKEIGISNNGVKYIKIKHSENIWSLIENLDIVGVTENQVVKRGQDIATARVGESVRFLLFKNNNQISNIKIENTKIVWKD